MRQFKINYRILFLVDLFWNVALIAVSQLSCRRHHPTSDEGVWRLLVFVNVFYLLYLIFSAPPRLFQVDKEAGTVTYALLFRLKKVVLDYNQVWSEFATVPDERNGSQKIWSLFNGEEEVVSISFRFSAWFESQIEELDSLLLKK